MAKARSLRNLWRREKQRSGFNLVALPLGTIYQHQQVLASIGARN